jgi:hypothetical protein
MKSPFTSSRLTVAIPLVFLVLASPAVAAGRKSKAKAAGAETVEAPRAREARERGIVALNLGRYEEAAKELENAYELSRDPNILFSLVTAYRLAGKPELALRLCASFLRSTEALTARNRPQIERTVAELEIIVEQMRLHPSESGTGSKGTAAVLPAEAIEPPAAGKTEPTAAVKAQSESKEHFLAATVAVAQPASDSNANLLTGKVPPPPARNRPFYRSPWVWTAVGVVVAGGVSFLIYESTRSPGPPATSLGAQRMF